MYFPITPATGVTELSQSVAYLEFGIKRVRGRVGFIHKLRLLNITIYKVAEISPIKLNGNNTIKIRVTETLFTQYQYCTVQ